MSKPRRRHACGARSWLVSHRKWTASKIHPTWPKPNATPRKYGGPTSCTGPGPGRGTNRMAPVSPKNALLTRPGLSRPAPRRSTRDRLPHCLWSRSIDALRLVVIGSWQQIIALVAGHILESIHLTLYLGLAGTLFTVLIVVPPWPFYNRHPEPWLSSGRKAVGTGIEVDGKKIN